MDGGNCVALNLGHVERHSEKPSCGDLSDRSLRLNKIAVQKGVFMTRQIHQPVSHSQADVSTSKCKTRHSGKRGQVISAAEFASELGKLIGRHLANKERKAKDSMTAPGPTIADEFPS
jgi:hypothetical protein